MDRNSEFKIQQHPRVSPENSGSIPIAIGRTHEHMNLIIDIGNSSTKLYLFKGDEILWMERKDSIENSYIDQLIQEKNVQHVIVSSVGEPSAAGLSKGREGWLEFNRTTAIPIKNLYESKETLGLDRLAAACGAWKIFPGKNILSIDMGTCITYDFLNSKGEYLGGAISPGLQMRFKAMHTFTAKLPLIEAQDQMLEQHIGIPTNERLIGRNTLDSMRAGAIRGMLLEIKGFVESYQRNYPDLQCLVCGGDAVLLDTEHKNSIFVRTNLVAEGLNTILNYNVQK